MGRSNRIAAMSSENLISSTNASYFFNVISNSLEITFSWISLLIRTEQGLIVYQQLPDGRISRTLTGADDPYDNIWNAPRGRLAWKILKRADRPYAVEIHTSVVHPGNRREQMKNTHLFYVGADQIQGICHETQQ